VTSTLRRLAWRVRRVRRPLVEVTAPPDEIVAEWDVPVTLHLSADGEPDPSVFVAVTKLHHGVVVHFEGSYGFDRDAVTTGWQRAAFRELDEELSAPYRPVHTFRRAEPLRAGEIVPVDVELREQATRFRSGDVLRLSVGGRWHFPRNPVTGQFPSGYRSSRRGASIRRHCCSAVGGRRRGEGGGCAPTLS
jgi:hypothetical protein